MPARIKLLRLLGAVLLMLALVPWLGVAPAAATGGDGHKGSNAAGGPDETAARPGRADAGPGSAERGHDGERKVTLCHRTNSATNPYVTIRVSINSVIKRSGHDGHQGPVYAGGMKAAKQKWGDIIPAFSYQGASYAGRNWPAGRAIFDAGCASGGGGQPTTVPPTAPTSTTPSHGGNGHGGQKVTLCHRTNSATNPYVRITVSINSVIKKSGHDRHNGPVFASGMKAAKQKWGDIIPGFTYTTKLGSAASYGGKNLPAGQAILDAGCTIAGQPTTATSTSPPVSRPTTAGPGSSVLPTKIGKPDDDDDTRVLGTRKGPLAATGLDLPLGESLGLSLALLIGGGALMVLPGRVAIERARRH